MNSYFLSAKKLTPKQSHHNRSHQSLSTKQAYSPGKTCASSYEKNSIDSLNQQLAVSYQFDASGNRVQVSNAPAGGAAAETGTYSYDASAHKAWGQVLNSYFLSAESSRQSKSSQSFSSIFEHQISFHPR